MHTRLKRILSAFPCLAFCLSLQAAAVDPIASEAPSGNAGLFVGINQFPLDPVGLTALRFAVDDAVAQAHLFTIELKLIRPTNCWLALGGASTSAITLDQMARLQEAGAHRVNAQKATILKSLADMLHRATGTSDCVVVSLSSHGFEEDGDAFVMPSDGMRGYLGETGLKLKTVGKKLAGSQAGKRLLLVDACRDPSQGIRGVTAGMSAGFLNALRAAEGQAVFSSCSAGQISLEREDLGHGVFTYFMIEALRGKAEANAEGFITLGSMAHYVAEKVEAWGRGNVSVDQSLIQQPSLDGPLVAKKIPLAMISSIRDEAAKTIEALRQRTKLNGKFDTVQYTSLVEMIRNPPSEAAGRDLMQSAQAFVDGRMAEETFVKLLEIATPTLAGRSAKEQERPVPPVPADVNAYLMPDSTPPGSIKDYKEFTNRFEKLANNEIRDRMLNKTWIVLRDIKNWGDAKEEAIQRQARLPNLEELKTLILYEPQTWNGASEIFLNTNFFPKLDRTTRCWTSEGTFLSQNKRYIDFAKRIFDSTSKSEMLAVILIRD